MSDDFSLFDLFREEARSQAATLSAGLLALEESASDPRKIEPLMRAAHSLKGAARIVGLEPVVGLAHVMEDALVAAQHGKIVITPADIDELLRGTDLLAELAETNEETVHQWGVRHEAELQRLATRFRDMAQGKSGEPAPVRGRSETRREDLLPLTGAGSPSSAAALLIPRDAIAPGDDFPLFDLFREELRSRAVVLHEGISKIDNGADAIEPLAEAARGIRGAARIVHLEAAGTLAGAIEEALSHAARNAVALNTDDRDTVVRGLGVLVALLEHTPDSVETWHGQHAGAIDEIQTYLSGIRARMPVVSAPVAPADIVPVEPPARLPVGPVVPVDETPAVQVIDTSAQPPPAEAVVRVTAGSLNRLMGLAGESLVQARWLQPFSTSLLKLKKHQDHLVALIDTVSQAVAGGRRESLDGVLDEMRKQAGLCRQVLGERMSEFDAHAAQAEDLNSRLYREVIVSRMRPFSDGAHGFPRLVRDMARSLDKQVRLEINGQSTEVDRDILEKLEAPLTHLLRNSIDHGIESPDARRAAGKSEQGVVRLDVHHRAGMLAITVSDDGKGVDLDRLRRKIVERGLNSQELVGTMTEPELLEFLFLPGFSTAKGVTEYSGRGVGLDVVQDTIRRVGGSVRISSRPGVGTTFHLSLPITLSVLRAVLVDIAGEPYAFPHNRIDRLLRVPRATIRSLEHRQFITVDGQNVALVVAAQLLDLPGEVPAGDELPVLLLSDDTGQYGLIVESFKGEQDLVVRPLDPRLGKVPNVSAAAILDDGSPVLIADVEDLIRSMDHFIQSGSLLRCDEKATGNRRKKRVLVVDDSITVREVERQLLRHQGYEVAVAVDGVDGWNQVRAGAFDLVISDVDMPRMTGLDLVKAIRQDERIGNVPIIIVSYKDRDEDRLRGMELGANSYLTKSSFHDNTFLEAVVDLIGEA